MLENLFKLVQEHAGDSILNNPAIPNEKNDEAVSDAASAIVGGLKTTVASGNTNSLLQLFRGGAEGVNSSPVTQNIQDGFVHNLMQKFGLDKGKAGGIAASLIPLVLKKFVQKTNDPSDSSFNFGSIVSNLSGGGAAKDVLTTLGNDKEGGVLGKIKGLFN